MTSNADDRIDMVTRSQLARMVGVDRNTLLRWEIYGLIPAAVRINQTVAGYSPETVLLIQAYVLAYKDELAKKRAKAELVRDYARAHKEEVAKKRAEAERLKPRSIIRDLLQAIRSGFIDCLDRAGSDACERAEAWLVEHGAAALDCAGSRACKRAEARHASGLLDQD